MTMMLIAHATVDSAVNLTSGKTEKKNMSPLIYETSLTIDTQTKSSGEGSLRAFVSQ